MSRKYEITSRINNAKQIEQQMNNLVDENARLEREMREIEAKLSKVRKKIKEAQSDQNINSPQDESDQSKLNDWNTFHLQEKVSSLKKELKKRKDSIDKNLNAISGLSATFSQEKSNLENILHQERESGEKRGGEIRSLDTGKIGNEATKREYINIERTLGKAYAANLENSNMINAYLGKPQAEKQVYSADKHGNKNYLANIVKTFEQRAFTAVIHDQTPIYHRNSSTLEDRVVHVKTSPVVTNQSLKNSTRYYRSMLDDYINK